MGSVLGYILILAGIAFIGIEVYHIVVDFKNKKNKKDKEE
jgi:hypothetical protein